ncbi:class I SAM-dependent methyltransferase [Acinetobacter larvae]|uniref:Ribosomal RNA small subunit methyltransferase C n=1 Tax=Acinetobacter larvae TaxID=1789224 RepID=A0A1B2LX28_9GAMM|nr:class I SAM-dependent methyltransferase [Acinetobacter larvae]AOA57498.1 16S rRNA methyltransferase [Acinetobacter larvae]
MDPRSEVILRQQDYLTGRVLFINAPADALLSTLDVKIDAEIWCWNYADHQAHIGLGYTSYFAVQPPQNNYDQVVIYVPKSKNLLEYVLNQALSLLKPTQRVLLVGEKKGGIERAAKQLKHYGQSIKLDSARHCQLWCMQLAQAVIAQPLDSWIKKYQVQYQQHNLTICALPGVFSQDHLDTGTAVLLPYLEQVKSGQLADFGCGAGIIACFLAKFNLNNIIYALDVDAFALKSTELTFAANAIHSEQLHIVAVTGVQDIPEKMDAIISNPPFHQGIHTDYDTSEALCHYARQHLKNPGELWIVANRFLNYANLIGQHFTETNIKADNNGFKVIYALAHE